MCSSDLKLSAPSLIIVGECARQREQLAWFERRPLFGKRIGILRAAEQAGDSIELAFHLGAQPISLPVIQILPPEEFHDVDEAISSLAEVDWLVFTSANGVSGLLNRIWETGEDVRRLSHLKLAAIGPATARELEKYHLRADIVPSEFRAEALAESLKPLVSGKRVLWARSEERRVGKECRSRWSQDH